MSVAKPIPLSVPVLRGNELAYLRECVETNWISYAGPFVPRFEQAMATFVGTRFATAVNSGTAALHLALLVSGVRPGDEVLVPSLTFIAPVNAIRYCQAHPVFMDVEPRFRQMDPEKVKDFLEKECSTVDGRLVNRRSRRPVTALLPVHILGHPVEMDPILELARRFDLRVIEDATESLGATYHGRQTGSLGDIACFSFNGNKIITTGGGGMITTDRQDWADRAKHLSTQAKSDAFEYFHDEVGYNYRLTNLQAAVGLAQMEYLPEYVRLKRSIADRYAQQLAGVGGLALPLEASTARSTYWLYTVAIEAQRYGMDARQAVARLRAENIEARPLWGPAHQQAAFRECQSYRIEVATRLFQECLSLPCSVCLTVEELGRVTETIRRGSASNNQTRLMPTLRK